MNNTIQAQVVGLAGLCQAATLVDDIASGNQIDPTHLSSSALSILKVDAEDELDVFGGIKGVQYGLFHLAKHMNKEAKIDITRYMIALIHLARKLSKNSKQSKALQHSIQATHRQFEFFDELSDPLFYSLGNIYTQQIRPLGPTILVKGDENILSNELNAAKVRSLLLAGVRSAILWQQAGGRRWHFIFKFRQISAEIERLQTLVNQS